MTFEGFSGSTKKSGSSGKALGYEACLKGYTVLFSTAVGVINTLSAAQATGQLKNSLKAYHDEQ